MIYSHSEEEVSLTTADAKQLSQITFNRQAFTYDQGIEGRHARSLYPVMLKKLSAMPCTTVLDLGCGTGEMLRRLLLQKPVKQAYGLDLSENMLAVAEKKLGGAATLVLGDSEHLPFDREMFDIVYCNDSFHHYPAPENVLGEVYRVLKPGGSLVIGDCWHPGFALKILNFYIKHSREGDVRIYSEKEMRDLLSRHFCSIRWEPVGRSACVACATKQ